MKKFNLQLFAEGEVNEQNIQVQNQEAQAQTIDIQQVATQNPTSAVSSTVTAENAPNQPTYFQQVEQLTKAEIQNRLQALKDEETALLEAAKKFKEEEKAKIVAYVKDHGLEVGMLVIVLLKLFGVLR